MGSEEIRGRVARTCFCLRFLASPVGIQSREAALGMPGIISPGVDVGAVDADVGVVTADRRWCWLLAGIPRFFW
jgi:hypothetical protein